MELRLRSLDFAKGDRSEEIPLNVTLLYMIPGPDRPDYWLGRLREPLHWASNLDGSFEITHLVLATQWENTEMYEGVTRLPVGIAYVIDQSLLQDDELDLEKIRYVATGVADDVAADDRPFSAMVSKLTGTLGKMFGRRSRD